MNQSAKEEAFKAMSKHNFSYVKRIAWWIWAARANVCPKCNAEPYSPCLNLTEKRKGNEQRTKWPHDPRVNWTKMVQGLRERGYIVD